MLSREDNDFLCRVGPGTPMGDLIRQYWIPFLPSRDLPEPDSRPLKVRLLGEDLIAFRDSEGKVGLVDEACPHRGANMYWARNENCGLRCVYHGWKFDVSGKCVDMPNEPEESNFHEKVRLNAYPTHEVNHLIWTYMGPEPVPPPFPPFELNTLAPEYVYPPHVMTEECNWVQGLEGDIDTSHIDWVHGRLNEDKPGVKGGYRGTYHRDRRPRLEVLPTPYGGCYTGSRQHDDEGTRWHRITQFIMPFHTMIAAAQSETVTLRAWVPIDDEHHMLISQTGRLDRPVREQEKAAYDDPFKDWGGYVERTADPLTRYLTKARLANDYLIDMDLQKNHLMFGVPFIGNIQDRAMTEAMGPIYKRWQEHLGTTDAMVIFMRRTLINAAHALREQGIVPANVTDPTLNRVRSASVLLPEGKSWIEATEDARNVDSGVPVASVYWEL